MVVISLLIFHNSFTPESPMHGCRLSLVVQCLAFLLACWCIDAARAQAYGPWRIPSTAAQFFGFGFGAGHHAPIVRSLGGCPPRIARVAFVPANQSFITSACAFESFNEAIRHPVGCRNGLCVPNAAPVQVPDVKVQEPSARKQAQPSLSDRGQQNRVSRQCRKICRSRNRRLQSRRQMKSFQGHRCRR